jgi:hypothetical protein
MTPTPLIGKMGFFHLAALKTVDRQAATESTNRFN